MQEHRKYHSSIGTAQLTGSQNPAVSEQVSSSETIFTAWLGKARPG